MAITATAVFSTSANEQTATPTLFAPGIISKPGRLEAHVSFTPDGKECYLTTRAPGWAKTTVYHSICADGEWSEPKVTSFSDDLTMSPVVSADNQRLYFISARPTFPPANIWMMERTGKGWSEPVKMESPLNSISNEWSLHIDPSGTYYTCSWREGGVGECDLWEIRDGKATNLESLNSSASDCHPIVDSKVTYLIFNSVRENGYGKMDLYISFKQTDGSWGVPVSLGSNINTPANEGGPFLSSDDKTLYFSRSEGDEESDIYQTDMEALLAELKSDACQVQIAANLPTAEGKTSCKSCKCTQP